MDNLVHVGFGVDPDVMIADALTRPPSLDEPLTADDVLATLGL